MRFTADLPESTKSVIGNISVLSGLKKKNEILGNALSLFNWALKEVAAGRQIASIDPQSESYTKLHMSVFDNCQNQAYSEESEEQLVSGYSTRG